MDQEIQKWLNGEITDDQLKELIGESEALKYIQIVGEVDSWVPDQATSLLSLHKSPIDQKGKYAR